MEIYYKEVQNCGWMYVLFAPVVLILGFILPFTPEPLTVKIGLPLLFIFLAMSVSSFTFVVSSESVDIHIGLIKIFRKKIRKSDIESWEIKGIRPVRDFGGWGIRRGRDGIWAYTFDVKQGVLIKTKQGGKYLLGSRKPYQLLQAIEKSMSRKEE